MKLLKLRWRASKMGLVVEETQDGLLVTNCGTAKTLKEVKVASLNEVAQVLANWRNKNGEEDEEE